MKVVVDDERSTARRKEWRLVGHWSVGGVGNNGRTRNGNPRIVTHMQGTLVHLINTATNSDTILLFYYGYCH